MITETTRGADLAFDAARHEYRLPDGRLVPNVTTILQETGVATDFDEIASRSSSIAQAIEYRRRLGVAAHADCHAFDDDDLDWRQVHPDVLPYVKAWAAFRESKGARPLARERRVFHARLFYCGTLDGIFELPTGRHVLIDIKLGDPFHAAAHLQTAAYQDAYREECREAASLVLDRWAVRLIPDRRIPYDITPYSDWQDVNRFRAVLTTFYEQPERRRSAR